MASYKNRVDAILEKIRVLENYDTLELTSKNNSTSEAHQACMDMIKKWMNAAGLETHVDTIGNLRGVLKSENPNAKTLVIGSNLDSILNSGKFDGSLGIVCALDIAANLSKTKNKPPFHLEVIVFCEFGGNRFHVPFLGSKVVAGKLRPATLERKDQEGVSLEDYLHSLGKQTENLKGDKIPAKDWLGYYEIQIEQGPVLYQQGLPVGPVTAISGRKVVEIIFEGRSGHAGTIPMDFRKDALCAAAEFILEAEEYATPARRNVLVTVGRIHVKEAAANKIPAKVSCTLDIRSADESRLNKAYEALNKICERVCHKRSIYFEWKFMHETDPVLCDENLRLLLGQSIRRQQVDLVDVVSGTSQDASVISTIAPVSVLFVKCIRGAGLLLHEMVEPEDIAVALKVSDDFISSLAKKITDGINTNSIN